MKFLIPILFALGTALCWGLYGPTIANARSATHAWSPFKPYVFIGVAYLVIAVVGGMIGMAIKGDNFNFFGEQVAGAKWGFIAGSLGALGALCLTTAMITSKGNAILVMPIVFGGAVSISAIVSVIQLRAVGTTTISPLLWVGMALVLMGIVLVSANTPHAHPPKKHAQTPTTPAVETPTDETLAE